MAKRSKGYAIITDQGDPKWGDPVKYLQVRFPGLGKEILPEHMLRTDDIHDATIFNLGKPGHRAALAVADQLFPNAVPVKVTVIRTITIHVEFPDEDASLDSDRKRAHIQLP